MLSFIFLPKDICHKKTTKYIRNNYHQSTDPFCRSNNHLQLFNSILVIFAHWRLYFQSVDWAIMNQRCKSSVASFLMFSFFNKVHMKHFLPLWIVWISDWVMNSLTEKLHDKESFSIFHTGFIVADLLAHWDKLCGRIGTIIC